LVTFRKYWREPALVGQLGNMAKYQNSPNCQPKGIEIWQKPENLPDC